MPLPCARGLHPGDQRPPAPETAMKLIIQIPCFNEELQLPVTLAALPRQVRTIEHFSAGKKLLQRLGSWVVRQASATDIPDATSGFRAYNREAALQTQAVSRFTYTLETLIQAGKLLVAVEHVPVRTNPKTRESRLFPSTAAYVRRNALSVFRVYSQYQPLKVFWGAAAVCGLAALGFVIRFLVP